MSVILSIKNVPEGLVARLRDRARRNHRSMHLYLARSLNAPLVTFDQRLHAAT